MTTKTRIPVSGHQDIVDLIERYKRLAFERAREAERRADELKAHIGNFWPQFKDARAAYAQRERTEAPRFNLMRLLELERLERNHSRILADLLDPRGTHGQGTLFLELFFDHIGLSHIKSKVSSPVGHVEVKPEAQVTGESRPDLVIRCIPFVLVVIENKIRSGESQTPDGRRQLQKYRDWLDSQTAGEKRLLFLTIHGERSQSGAEDCCLSYIRDVRKWLGQCLERVAAPGVQHALQQYLETIEDLRRLRTVGTDGGE